MLEDVDTKEQHVHSSHRDIGNLDFQIMLTNNYYMNPSSMYICFPMKIEQKSDSDSDLDADLITVNNFIAHFVKEISAKRYGNDKHLTPTSSTYEIYQYSDSMLKHLPKGALKKIEKTML